MGAHARWWMQHIDGVTVPLMCLLGLVALVGVVIQARLGNVQCAVRAVILVAGTQLTVETLKHVIHRADGAANTSPSGHTSLVLSLALVAIALWPQKFIRIAVFTLAAFVAYGTIIGGWHTPGDVIAASAIAGCWRVLTGTIAMQPILPMFWAAAFGMFLAAMGFHLRQIDIPTAILSGFAVLGSLLAALIVGSGHDGGIQ